MSYLAWKLLQMRCSAILKSPCGDLLAVSCDEQLTHLLFADGKHAASIEVAPRTQAPLFVALAEQLASYFAGERKAFELPLAPHGTDFQQQVWSELEKIPYGATISYGELARRIDNPKAVRAVGGANNKNPITIVIPCHRVVGSTKTLVGYGGGLERKKLLLSLEGRSAEAVLTGTSRQLELRC